MSYDFDVVAATDAIAALEESLSEITNSFGYGLNPVEIQGATLLPAVVHISLGPSTAADGAVPGLLTMGASYQLNYRIASRILIVESVGKKYPADEAGASPIWQAVAGAFFNKDNAFSLAATAFAHTYSMDYADPSYGVQPWPPEPMQLKYYWTLDYVHTFTFTGG